MNIGKLSNEDLKKIILGKLHQVRDDIILRPGIGEDSSIVDFGDEALVISADPITGASKNIGSIAVNVNCNDIAATGGEPVGIMLTILAPESTTLDQLEEIMADASDTCRELGIEILGGHTEITDAVTRTVLSVTAIGKMSREKCHKRSLIEPGDSIMMTKLAGLEGTGIIACEMEDEVSAFLSEEEIRRAASMLGRISVVMDSRIASRHGALQMHDITEGGVLGAIWEICESVGLGCDVSLDAIHVDDVTRKICAHYSIDPLKLISSGSMLIAVKKRDMAGMLEALAEKGIECSMLGEFVAGDKKTIFKGGVAVDIEPPESDELYKVV